MKVIEKIKEVCIILMVLVMLCTMTVACTWIFHDYIEYFNMIRMLDRYTLK